jgi:hypothetical protein
MLLCIILWRLTRRLPLLEDTRKSGELCIDSFVGFVVSFHVDHTNMCDEIRRAIQILARRTKNNPVLIGEPGVGKTAIAEGEMS